jgi:hypothetical protein
MRTNSSECRISTPSPLDQNEKSKQAVIFKLFSSFRAYLLQFSGPGELSIMARSRDVNSGNNLEAKVKDP